MDEKIIGGTSRREDDWGGGRDGEDGPLAVFGSALAVAWRRRLPLILWVVACVVTAFAYAHSVTPSFTATATMLLVPRPQVTTRTDMSSSSQSPILDTAQADSQLQVIRSERLLGRVFDGLDLASVPELAFQPAGVVGMARDEAARLMGLPTDREPTADERREIAFANFVGRIAARRVGLSYVIEVSYSSGDPTLARRVANATVSAYLGQSVRFKAEAAKDGAEFLQSRVTSLVAQSDAASAGVAAGTLPDSPTPDADARVIGAALQPLGRSTPRTGLIVGSAAAFGLIAAILALTLAAALDKRIRTPETLRRDTGLRCLGVVPKASRRSDGLRRRSEADMQGLATSEPDAAFAAALRDLRTAVMSDGTRARKRLPGRSVALASWTPDAGCTTLAANLARVVAASGHHVSLIDADVHRAVPGLTPATGVVRVGLSDALVTGRGLDDIDTVEVDGVTLVPARSTGSDRTHNAYLGSPETNEIIEQARARGDVFVDLPPLSTTGDARAAATYADGVVIVVVAGKTTRDEVAKAVTTIEGAGGRVLGAVLNKARG